MRGGAVGQIPLGLALVAFVDGVASSWGGKEGTLVLLANKHTPEPDGCPPVFLDGKMFAFVRSESAKHCVDIPFKEFVSCAESKQECFVNPWIKENCNVTCHAYQRVLQKNRTHRWIAKEDLLKFISLKDKSGNYGFGGYNRTVDHLLVAFSTDGLVELMKERFGKSPLVRSGVKPLQQNWEYDKQQCYSSFYPQPGKQVQQLTQSHTI
jgi:hypothetical protein